MSGSKHPTDNYLSELSQVPTLFSWRVCMWKIHRILVTSWALVMTKLNITCVIEITHLYKLFLLLLSDNEAFMTCSLSYLSWLPGVQNKI